MLKRDYDNQVCSIARSLEVIGERWTMLILRDCFVGVRRFDDFQRSLGIARNVLSTRLQRLVDAGILEKRAYEERPVRYEYRLTAKGKDLWPVLMTLSQWGDRYESEAGAPWVFEHRGCGGQVDAHLCCDRCGEPLDPRKLERKPGPGYESIKAA
ncbi:MAG TPA: helix-turn-helix domain-containing protein [Thermoleophilaceae bacterium]